MNVSQLAYPHIQNLITKGQIRSKAVSMAIGFAIARHAPLPESAASVPYGYFLELFGDNMDGFLGQVVELGPVDYKLAREYAKKFYSVRHDQVFTNAIIPQGGLPIYDFFGFSQHLSEEDIAILHSNDSGFRENAMFFYGLIIDFLK